MSILARVSAPVVWVLKASTEGLLRVTGLNRTRQSEVTEEEINALIDEGHNAGLIEPEEREMIVGVMRLGDRTVRAIMTPRPEIVWLDPNWSREQCLRAIGDSGHSRFPVAAGGLDHLVGVVQAKELLTQGAFDLRTAMRHPLVVPESMSVLRLLEAMRESAVRMAFVADEYGVVHGLVTPADLLEAIAGDVALPRDEAIDAPVKREDGSWLIDGMMPIDEFERLVRVSGLAEEGHFDTVAGLVVSLMGKLPATGDTVEHYPLRFEVADLDGRRVDKVIVRRLEDSDV
jgi:putative hemolysin